MAPPGSASPLTRAKAYLSHCGPAISGQGGHNTTFRIACRLIKGFHLPEEQALQLLLSEFNPRCQPPWTEQELRHKVHQASEKGKYPDVLAVPSPFATETWDVRHNHRSRHSDMAANRHRKPETLRNLICLVLCIIQRGIGNVKGFQQRGEPCANPFIGLLRCFEQKPLYVSKILRRGR
jgi:hypothetical protein